MDCDKKFRNEIGSYKRIRQIADRISADNNLSVVGNPELSKGMTNRYERQTKRDGFVGLIDEVLATGQPKSFDDFLKQLEKNGCKVKRRGKTISVCPPGAERFFRLKRRLVKILLIVSIVGIVCCSAYVAHYLITSRRDAAYYKSLSESFAPPMEFETAPDG